MGGGTPRVVAEGGDRRMQVFVDYTNVDNKGPHHGICYVGRRASNQI